MNPGNTKLSIKLTKEGDWVTLEKFLKHTTQPVALKRAITLGFRDFLRSYQWWAIKGLVTEGAAVGQTWEPTVHMGVSTGIRTGKYLAAIENMKISISGDIATLKFSRSDLMRKSHKGGLIMAKYMTIFEYGSVRQPPRPLWGPSFVKAGGNKRITNNALKAVEKYYSSIGVPQVKVKLT